MLIIVGEDADDFDQLRAELMDEHDPQSALEAELVERLAGILWRLRRAPFFEAAILDARHAQVSNQKNYGRPAEPEGEEKDEELDEEEADWETSVHFGIALMDGHYGDALAKIARHETTLMNAFREDAADAPPPTRQSSSRRGRHGEARGCGTSACSVTQ